MTRSSATPIHPDPHPLAGQKLRTTNGEDYILEDWWDRISGESWKYCTSNIAAMNYAATVAQLRLPTDDQVVYGKINGLGFLLHVTELAEEPADA